MSKSLPRISQLEGDSQESNPDRQVQSPSCKEAIPFVTMVTQLTSTYMCYWCD